MKNVQFHMPVHLRSRLLLSSVVTISLIAMLVGLIVVERLVSNAETAHQDSLVDAARLARELDIYTLHGIDETDAYALGQFDRLEPFIEQARLFNNAMAKLDQYSANQLLNQDEIQDVNKIRELRTSYETAALEFINTANKQRSIPTQENQALVKSAWKKQNDIGSELSAASQHLADQIESSYQALQIRISQRNNQMIAAVLIMGLLVIAIIVAIQSIASRAVGKPIDQLKGSLNAFLAGDQKQRVVISRRDEIGMLAESCNTLMATIQQQTSELHAQVETAQLARRDAENAHIIVAEKLEMIEAQQAVIDELSVPILPLSDRILVIPLIGSLDTQRLDQMQARMLAHAERSRHGTTFILDITGVPVVDTQVTQGLIASIRAARLIGVDVLLVGIRPEVAQSIVGLGIQLGEVVTLSSLQQGISYAFNHTKVRR